MRNNEWKWRIATTEAGLSNGSFIARGVPAPTQPQYRGHTVKSSQGEGGTGKYGYKSAEILWARLSMSQAETIYELVDDVGDDELYVTIYAGDGNLRWIDIAGRPDLSDIAPDQPIVTADGITVSNVLLSLNNVRIINNPADFS